MSDSGAPQYETVLYEVADRLATVTLNRPEVHNALSFQLRSVFAWKMSMAPAKYMQITGNSITGKQAAEWAQSGVGGWIAPDRTIRDALQWMSLAAGEVGLL